MKPDTRSFYEAAVRGAAEHVIAGLDGALDLQALARRAALSPFHFHRIFRGMLGETPLELHRRLRMERAAWCLVHEEGSVTAIAFAAGYETHESFTRAFRLQYDCSPSDARRSREAASACARPFQIQLPARSGIHFRPGDHQTLVLVESGDINMDVTTKTLPAMRVATVRHTGPYNRISEAFARLGQAVDGRGYFGSETQMLALYYDDPESTPATELRSDAGLTLTPDQKVPDGLGEAKLAAGRYACATHVGPYEQLGDAWARLMGEWLPKSGERMRDGVTFEIYRNTPATAPKEQLITELYLPLD